MSFRGYRSVPVGTGRYGWCFSGDNGCSRQRDAVSLGPSVTVASVPTLTGAASPAKRCQRMTTTRRSLRDGSNSGPMAVTPCVVVGDLTSSGLRLLRWSGWGTSMQCCSTGDRSRSRLEEPARGAQDEEAGEEGDELKNGLGKQLLVCLLCLYFTGCCRHGWCSSGTECAASVPEVVVVVVVLVMVQVQRQ